MPQRYTIPDLVDALVEHFGASHGLEHAHKDRYDVPPGARSRKPDSATPDFLRHRPRRLRRTAALRGLVRETRLSPETFIYPLFVCTGEGQRREVGSMPGVYQLSVDEVVQARRPRRSADGVPGVLLFGLPESKDPVGSGAYDPEGPVQAAVRALKQRGARTCSSSPTSASASTRRTALRDRRRRGDRQRRRPSSSSCAPRCRTRRPAPTSSRRRT